MNNEKILAGIDAGHVNTKAVIMRGREILACSTAPTGFDPAASAQAALSRALDSAGVSPGGPAALVTTGIYREIAKPPGVSVSRTVPEYVADARGAFFLNSRSRTVIDIGGNIHKAIRYDANGDLLDVIQNDKCADGLGIFYTAMARAMGLSEQEMCDLALESKTDASVAIQCALSAQSEAIDLMCRGVELADVANAVLKFMVERVAAMSTCMTLSKEIVVAGGARQGARSALAGPYRAGCDLVGYAGIRGRDRRRNRGWKMKTAAGVDIGAVSSKAVILVDGHARACALVPTRTPKESAVRAMDAALSEAGLKLEDIGCIVATGRGRGQVPFAGKGVTEIVCAAAGAVHIWGPSVRTVLDAGGISCRVVHCTGKGRATDFLWNDKCASGIGRSLETFAALVGKEASGIGDAASQSDRPAKIGNFCAVYAQSEALDLIRHKVPADRIVAGYHRAMAERIATLVARSGMKKDFVVIGGCSQRTKGS